MDISEDEIYDWLFEIVEGFTPVPGTEQQVGRQRWSIDMEKVFIEDATGKFWKLRWDQPASESQDGQDLNGTLHEVQKKTKNITYYE